MKNKQAELERFCRFCEAASPLQEEDWVLCEKKGIVSAGHCCRAFRYDPLKREPGAVPRPVALEYIAIDDESENDTQNYQGG